MKKLLSSLAILAVFTTLSARAGETVTAGSFFNKLSQKEQELNQKIDAQQKALSDKRAELQKKQIEQEKAATAKKEELKKQQEANQKALEQAKKDALTRRENSKKAIESEVNAWKNLFN